jgi:hypothetical protein
MKSIPELADIERFAARSPKATPEILEKLRQLKLENIEAE